MYRKDRGSEGRGVALIYKNSLEIIRMPDIPKVEGFFCRAYHDSAKFIIGGIYRPPSSTMAVFEELRTYLDTHIQLGDRIIFTGDFILPDVE